MYAERSQSTLIERFADAGIETADASETCVFVLVRTPDRAAALVSEIGRAPGESLRMIAMPPGDAERQEWAIAIPAVYRPFVEEHVRDLLEHRGYAGREEVLDMVERKAIGDAR